AIAERLPLDSQQMDALEFGCGTGLVGLELVSYLKSLTAVDTSRGMLEELGKKVREMGLAAVSVREIDLSKYNLEGKFDLIFSSMTLHHVDNIETILKQFDGHLYAGGYLAIADLDKEDGSFHPPDAPGVKHYGLERDYLRDLLTRLGFSEINFETVFQFTKEQKEKLANYPVFLLTARKK
ncbi:MAG: class I SAM-dependent DNA methyltransferase, partial [Desulfobia sp.]